MDSRSLCSILKLLYAAGAALLAAGGAAGAGVHVTVYNQDLALVKERREVEIPAGVAEFSFTGVPARIDPTSVRLASKGGGLTILEQNYRYDLVSREKLLERYLDKTARVLTKHDKFHEGVLKTTSGSLILDTPDGVVLLSADEIADITLPQIPEGLMTRPTLVWSVRNEGKPRREIEIAYLTGGLSWHAEYVGAVDPQDRAMKLSGWVSIENNSGTTYPEAHLKVVAGDVHRAVRPPIPVRGKGVQLVAQAGVRFEERAFFEYHIYDLARPTTLADREVKQIRLLEEREVPVEKRYVYEPTRGNPKVQVKLEFRNTEENKLGIPLPGGKLRVYREDEDGALEFAGEDEIQHTPPEEKVSVQMGNAFDLVGERAEKEMRRLAEGVLEQTIEIKLRNRKEKKEEVTILVREHPGGFWRVLEATHPYERPNARDLEFEIRVPAGEEVVLTYRVRSEF